MYMRKVVCKMALFWRNFPSKHDVFSIQSAKESLAIQLTGLHQALVSMAILCMALGCSCVAAALIDVFQTLFHPAGRGAMSDWTAKLIWRVVRAAAASMQNSSLMPAPSEFSQLL
jgi:hypothetical protein